MFKICLHALLKYQVYIKDLTYSNEYSYDNIFYIISIWHFLPLCSYIFTACCNKCIIGNFDFVKQKIIYLHFSCKIWEFLFFAFLLYNE